MRVLVTRPPREAQRWVEALQASGCDALALPLLEITPTRDRAALQQACRALDSYQALMFVSGNAVDHFFREKAVLAQEGRPLHAIKNRAWATGPGTRDALLAAGVAPGQIEAPAEDAGQFDSEALWQRVGGTVQAGDRVLIVRGADSRGQASGRDWLAGQLQAAGARVDQVLAYERHAPQWTVAQRALAQAAAGDGSVWLFSSSEAVANLRHAMPGQSWQRARAVATHPRIAGAAREAGFGVVCESRPALADVVASIESFA
ncbi:MAG: uroporphyrinogen-III synthase [Ramlibacter sp.]|nr:uroporphyrinogen-III synthase [Ramlibacter sp.]